MATSIGDGGTNDMHLLAFFYPSQKQSNAGWLLKI